MVTYLSCERVTVKYDKLRLEGKITLCETYRQLVTFGCKYMLHYFKRSQAKKVGVIHNTALYS